MRDKKMQKWVFRWRKRIVRWKFKKLVMARRTKDGAKANWQRGIEKVTRWRIILGELRRRNSERRNDDIWMTDSEPADGIPLLAAWMQNGLVWQWDECEGMSKKRKKFMKAMFYMELGRSDGHTAGGMEVGIWKTRSSEFREIAEEFVVYRRR